MRADYAEGRRLNRPTRERKFEMTELSREINAGIFKMMKFADWFEIA